MMTTTEKLQAVDSRLLGLRADYLACTALLRACDEAIERLAAFESVAGERTRVPRLALARLQATRDDWNAAAEDVSRQMEEAVRCLTEGAERHATVL
jgi:hypothetical protein